MEHWLHKCQQEMGEFPCKQKNRRVNKLLYHLFFIPKARPDEMLFWFRMVSFSRWLLPHCDVGEKLSFLFCYAQLWTYGIWNHITWLVWPAEMDLPPVPKVERDQGKRRHCRGRGEFMIGGLIISHSTFLHCALKKNLDDQMQFYIFALKCTAHILCCI